MSTTLRQRMTQDLQLAGLSTRTQEAYLRAVRQLATHFHTPPDRLEEFQVRDYLLHLKNERKFASASLAIAYSGIKFFYSHTEPRDWTTLKNLRVRRDKTLPDVLSIAETHQLIESVKTLHNRTYFWTVYSLGLRLNEGLHLQVGDIDKHRKRDEAIQREVAWQPEEKAAVEQGRKGRLDQDARACAWLRPQRDPRDLPKAYQARESQAITPSMCMHPCMRLLSSVSSF